jgi:hypothetical protein
VAFKGLATTSSNNSSLHCRNLLRSVWEVLVNQLNRQEIQQEALELLLEEALEQLLEALVQQLGVVSVQQLGVVSDQMLEVDLDLGVLLGSQLSLLLRNPVLVVLEVSQELLLNLDKPQLVVVALACKSTLRRRMQMAHSHYRISAQ